MSVFYIKMKLCTCFLLFGIFAYTNSSPLKKDGRHHHAALKTTQKSKNKENSKNELIVTDKTVVNDSNVKQPYSTVETFTDFIEEAVNILNTYKNDIFEDFIQILDKDIRKYHNKECKYYELKGKHEFRSLLAEKLDSFAKKSVFDKRAEINQITFMMKLKIFDKNLQGFLDYINSLYRDDAKEMFRKILTGLKGYSGGYGNSRTKDKFVKIVRECLRATVFHHTDLSSDVREKLRKYIAMFTTTSTKSPVTTSSTTKLFHFKAKDINSETDTVKNSDSISTEDKTLEISTQTNPTRTTEVKKEENKIVRTRAREEKKEDVSATDEETSKQDESTKQQKKSTYSTTGKTTTKKVFTKETKHKTTIKINTKRTTTNIKDENKSTRVFRTETNEARPTANEDKTTRQVEEETTIIEESKQDEKQEKNAHKELTTSSADENATEVLFFMKTEEPEIVYKSESRSDLVERMLGEHSTVRLTTSRPTITTRLRSKTKTNLQSSTTPQQSDEEGSEEVTDTTKHDKKQSKSTKHHRSSTIAHSTTPQQSDEESPEEEIDTTKHEKKQSKSTKNLSSSATPQQSDEESPEQVINTTKHDKKQSKSTKRLLSSTTPQQSDEELSEEEIDTTKHEKKQPSTKKTLRRSIAPALPGGQLSVEVFDRDRGTRKATPLVRSHSTTTVPHELNEYMNRKRSLEKEVERLRKIDEINHNSITNVVTDEDEGTMDMHYDSNENTYENKENEDLDKNKLDSRELSSEYKARVHRARNTNEDDVKNTNIVNEGDNELKSSEEIEESNESETHKVLNKKIDTINKPKNVEEVKTSTKKKLKESDESQKHKLKNMKTDTIIKSKKTEEPKTSTKKKPRKTAEFKSVELTIELPIAKDNSIITKVNHKYLAKTKFKAPKKIENTIWNVSEEVKQNRINEIPTDDKVKTTEDKIDEVTTEHTFRRVVETFPSLFEGNKLKEGLYPAHLWD